MGDLKSWRRDAKWGGEVDVNWYGGLTEWNTFSNPNERIHDLKTPTALNAAPHVTGYTLAHRNKQHALPPTVDDGWVYMQIPS